MQAPSNHLGLPGQRPVSCGARHAAGPQAPPRAAPHARELHCALPAPQRLDAPSEQGLRQRLESAFQLVRDDKWEPAGPAVLTVQLEPPRQTGGPRSERSPDFYANVGSAIRTLRDETPSLFQQDLTCAAPCRACRERAVWPRRTLHTGWYALEACTLLLWRRPECPVGSPGAGGADAWAARTQTTYTARTLRSETRATRSGASGADTLLLCCVSHSATSTASAGGYC